MTRELSKALLAVRMMSGITMWFEAEKVEKIKKMLAGQRANWPALVEIDGETFNPASVEGFYSPATMEAEVRTKNGQWMCKMGKWHDRREVCEHRPIVGMKTAHIEGVGEIKIPVYGTKE